MATTYFGYCNSVTGAGTGTTSGNTGTEMDWVVAGYSCPGSGSQNIITMGMQCVAGGVNVLMGIYAAGSLVVEGDAAKASVACPTQGDNIWTSWASGELTWHIGTTLTGGTTYVLAIACASNPGIWMTTGLPSGTSKYSGGDSTGGMPGSLPAGSNYTQELNVRCGVEAAAAGGISISQIADFYRHLRV